MQQCSLQQWRITSLTEADVEVEVLDNDNHVSGERPNDDVQEPLQHYDLQSEKEKA